VTSCKKTYYIVKITSKIVFKFFIRNCLHLLTENYTNTSKKSCKHPQKFKVKSDLTYHISFNLIKGDVIYT
jgi:hypothetical protein